MTHDNQPVQIEKIKVQPTHVAQVCPVCHGFTTVKYGTLPCGACIDPETKKSRGFILIPVKVVEGGKNP